MNKLSTKQKTLFTGFLFTLTLIIGLFLICMEPSKASAAIPTCTHWAGSCQRRCIFPYIWDLLLPQTFHKKASAAHCEELPSTIPVLDPSWCGEKWDAKLLGCPVFTEYWGDRTTSFCLPPE